MRRIDQRLTGGMIALMLSGVAWSKTDPECLKHLGGGYADTECYSGLRRDIEAQNQQVSSRIRVEIPTGNAHLTLLDSYMRTQDEALKFCELQRDASAKWSSNPDGSMYPALYEQCAFEQRKIQNKFLSDLLMMEQE